MSLLDSLPAEERGRARPAAQPDWAAPMLATLTGRRFSDPNWIYERKLDGERCLAFGATDRVRLISRNRKRIDAHYPEIAEALAAQGADGFIVDGEIGPSKAVRRASPAFRAGCNSAIRTPLVARAWPSTCISSISFTSSATM